MTELEFLHAELAVCIDTREQANLAENSLGRAISRLDKQRARIEARIAVLEADTGPDPTPTPTPTPPQNPDPEPDPVPDPEPDPAPTPTPVPVPTDGISIDGIWVVPSWMGETVTPAGAFQTYAIPGGFYLTQGDWKCLALYSAPHTEAEIVEEAHTVTIDGEVLPFTNFPGAVKAWENRPLPAHMDWLVAAVNEQRVLPYEARAFIYKTPELKPTRNSFGPYRTDKAYGRSGSNSIVGVVVGSAGEADSSRGFLSTDDAVLIAAALTGNAEVFAAAAERCREQMFAGLSIPKFAILKDAKVVNPQGPEPYWNEGQPQPNYGNDGKWTMPEGYKYADELQGTPGTTYSHGDRNEAHLFNHGFAYWLATGHPLAALLQHAIMAYTLASNYLRDKDGTVRLRFGYQRATLNQFAAMWKVRDVAANARSPLFMDRIPEINAEMWDDYKRYLGEMDKGATQADREMIAWRGIDADDDGAGSNFMIQAYGPEPAYLWALAGEPLLMTRIAENMVMRFGRIGGARGYYGTGSGSGFPVRGYNSSDELVADVLARGTLPTETFDNCPVHYVQRAYWALQEANAVGVTVDGLDAAITRMAAAIDATTKWASTGSVAWKHAATIFAEAI